MGYFDDIINNNGELDPATQQPEYNRSTLYKKPKKQNTYTQLVNKYPTQAELPPLIQPVGQYYPDDISKYDNGIPIEKLKVGEIDDWRSEQQGVLPSLGNSFTKFIAKTGVNVLGGTAGTVYGLANAAATGTLSGMWDNDVINELDSWSKSLDNSLPVYKSKDYNNSNFLEKFVHPLMLFDEFSDAASFTAGAVVTELLTAGIASEFVAARALNLIGKEMKAAKVLSTAENAAMKGLGKEALVFGRRVLTGANYEASIEANQAMQQYKQNAVNDYMKNNGITDISLVPNSEIDRIESDAQNMGNLVWAQNLAILHASNMIQFPATFGTKFNVAKKFLPKNIIEAGETFGVGKGLSKGLKETAEGGIEASYKSLGKFGNAASNAYTFAKNGITEGLWEEGMQGTVSTAAQDYWRKKYNAGNTNDAVNYAESFGEGLQQSYGTKEGWNQIGMGMLIGMIGSPGKGLLPGKLGIDKQTGKRGDLWQGGVIGEFKERTKEREYADKLVQKYNELGSKEAITPSLKAGIQQLVVEQQNSTEKNAALENDDKFGFKNSQDDSFFNFVNTNNKVGKFDNIINYLDNAEKLSSEEFKRAFFDESDDTVIDENKKREIIKGLRDKANRIKDRRATIDAIVETDPYHNYDETAEAYKDHLTYLMSKADMIDSRTADIVKKLSDITGNYLNGDTMKSYFDLATKTNTDKNTMTTLQNHIKGVNLLTKKLEKNEPILTQKINDNVKEEKELSDKLEKTSKKRDEIVRRSKKYADSAEVVGEKTDETQKTIDGFSKEIEQLDKETKKIQEKLTKNKEDQVKYNQQLSNDKSSLEKATKEYNDFVKENYNRLKQKSDNKSVDNPEFKYDNFEDYVADIDKLYQDSNSISDLLKSVYDKDPLSAEELVPLIEDLGKLTKMRQDLINMYNLHKSSTGRNILMKAMQEADAEYKSKLIENATKFEDIKDKFILGKTYKATINDNGIEKQVAAKIINTSKGIALRIVDIANGKDYGIYTLSDVNKIVRSGFLQSLDEITVEDIKKAEVQAEVATHANMNMETGEYSLTGTLVKVGEDEYLQIDAKDSQGNSHIRYYEVDEDGNIESNYETTLEGDITVIENNTTRKFNGQLYNYTAANGNTSIGVLVNVSPFLDEDVVNKLENLPTKVIINYVSSKETSTVDDEEEIKKLVELAKKAKLEKSREFEGNPVFTYKGERITISYKLKESKLVYKRSRKGKKWGKSKKTWIHTTRGKQNLPVYKLEPKTSLEEVLSPDELLNSSQFHKPHVSKVKISNFSEAKEEVEVVQDKYVGTNGDYYIIVKYKDELYAVPRKDVFYQIDPDTGIIRHRPVAFDPKRLSIIGYDKEPELSKDTIEEKISPDERFGKLLPDYFYTAGLDVLYTTHKNSEGKITYYTNRYNDDGTVQRNQDPSQVRWYDFVKDKSISSEEFTKKYKLRFVINNGEFVEAYNPEDTFSPSTTDIIVDGKVISGKEEAVDIRVVLVDKVTNEPIRDKEGKLLFTSIHTSSYEGVTGADIEAKKETNKLLRKALITKLNNKEVITTDIIELSSGSIIKEQPIEQTIGTDGKYNARSRNSVKGRIIKSTESFNTIQWGIVKVTKTGQVISVAFDSELLNNNSNENGMVFTGNVKDRNNKSIKTKLLTRPLDDSEATTAAQMIKLAVNGTKEINGNLIIPSKGEINNPAENPLISRIIKWGINKNNKKTQIFIDKNGNLILGDNYSKLSKKDLSTDDGMSLLTSWLKDTKIAHVSEKYRGSIDFITYKYEDGKFISETWNTYNDYLFDDKSGARVPILTTDVIKLDENAENNSNQLSQVNLRFSTDGFITKPEFKKEIVSKKDLSSLSNEELEDIYNKGFNSVKKTITSSAFAAQKELLGRSDNEYAPDPETLKIPEGFTLIEDTLSVSKKEETDEDFPASEGVSKDMFLTPEEASPESIDKDESKAIVTKVEEDKPKRKNTGKFRLINTTEPYNIENIKESEVWFKSKFPNIPISYGKFSALTRIGAWGKIETATGVLVDNLAKEGTTYHEAWHVVSLLGLSKEERIKLYNIVREELKDDKITNSQAEEILADDFMLWKLNGKSDLFIENKEKRSLFQKLADFIQKLWKSLVNNRDIDGLEIYKNIEAGKYSYVKLAKENKSVNRLQGLSVTESEDLLEGISYYAISKLYTEYNAEIGQFGEYSDKIIKDVITDILEDDDVTSKIKAYIKDGSNTKNLAEGIKQYFEYIGIGVTIKDNKDIEDTDTQLDESEQGKDSNAYLDAVMFSSMKNTSKEIKLLIATLPQTETEDNESYVVLNDSGLPKLTNFGKTYMNITRALAGTQEIDGKVGMIEKLRELAKTSPEIDRLLARLEALEGDQAIKTWMQFRQAFSINEFGFQLFLISKEANKFVESNRTKASDKAKEVWNNGYKESKVFQLVKEDKWDEAKKELKSYLDIINTKGATVEAIQQRIDATIKGLELIGIKVTEGLFTDTLLQEDAKLFLADFIALKKPIFDLTKQFQAGRLTKLAVAQGKFYEMFIEAQHLNAENKSVYEFSLNNYLSGTVNEIKQCALLPTVEERLERFNKELPHLMAIAQYSSWVRNIINELSKPTPNLNIKIDFLEGTKEEGFASEGMLTNDLSTTSLANLHLHAMFNKRGGEFYPRFVFRRPSDKSLEPSLVGMPFISSVDSFRLNMMNYLKFELDVAKNDVSRLNIFRKRIGKDKQIILSDEAIETIKTYAHLGDVLQNSKVKYLIERDIDKFLARKTEENIEFFKEIGVIREQNTTISKELLDTYKGDINALVRDFTMNWTVGAFEQQLMFHGEFAQYKDFFKRTSGYVGTGKTLSRDTIVNEKIQQGIIEFLKESKAKGTDISNRIDLAYKLSPSQRSEFEEFLKLQSDKTTINSTNIITLKDRVEKSNNIDIYKEMLKSVVLNTKQGKLTSEQIKNYMKAYEEMNLADGLGYVTIEEYRNFLLKTGDWDLLGKQEKTYQRVIKGEELSIEDMAYFPVIKPQGFGIKDFRNIITEDNIESNPIDKVNYEMVFAKLSLMPIIPLAVESLEMGNLLKSMQQSGATVAIMESGLKLGKENAIDFKGDVIQTLPSFNMDMKYWKIQVDMHNDIAEVDTDGTQQRKLLWQDLFEYGKPINDKFTQLHAEYSDTYQRIIDLERVKFLKELSIEDKGNHVYEITDYKVFTAAIRKEIASRRLPSNILEAITTNSDGKMLFPIDALPISGKIENILLARINNNLIKLKRPGAAYVQTSNLYWKSNANLSTEQQTKVKQFAQELHFLRSENGKIIGAEVYLPSTWFGKEVDINNIDPRLLHVLGYRIPTQGQNSMLPLVIKGFLPAEMADTIIVPFEIVAQSGSDFDIDKLHIFRPNFVEIDGKFTYLDSNVNIQDEIDFLKKIVNSKDVEYSKMAAVMVGTTLEELKENKEDLERLVRKNLEKNLLQNRLLEIQLEVLTDPANTRNLLVPNGADFLKEEADWTIFLKTYFLDNEIPITITDNIDLQNKFKRWRENRAEKLKKEGANPETLISFKHEIETAQSFKGGKKGVGIVANQITAHSLFQEAGTVLSGTMKVKKNGKYGKPIPVIFNFHHNKQNEKASLAGIYDISGNLISEVNSEHLTGNVDIAKDPFIFTLNTNGLTSNVKYMLLNLGADRQWVNRFINQPIIEEYVKSRLINESIEIQSTRGEREFNEETGWYESTSDYESEDTILNELFTKYGGKTSTSKGVKFDIRKVLDDIHSVGKFFNLEELDKYIIHGVKNSTDSNYMQDQIHILADFIAYQQYGREFNNGIQAVKPDTRRVKNLGEASKVIDDIQRVKDVNFYENIDNLLDKGILKGFHSAHAQFMKDVYKSLFITELDSIQSRIYKVIKDDLTFNGMAVMQKELDVVQQTILTYLFQVAVNRYINKSNTIISPISAETAEKLMVGNKSAARVIQSILKEGGKISPVFTELLYPQLNEDNEGIDLIKTINKQIDAFTADRFAELMEELYEKNPKAYNIILQVAAIEFGMTGSAMSYMKYLDSKRIGEIFSPIINKLMQDNDFDSLFSNLDKAIDDIYLNNKRNNYLIPKVTINKTAYYPTLKKSWGDKQHVIAIKEDNFLYGRRFIKMTKKIKEDTGLEKWVNTIYKFEGYLGNEAIYVKVNTRSSKIKEFHNNTYSIDIDENQDFNTISDEIREDILAYFKVNNLNVDNTPVEKSIEQREEEAANWQDKNCK